ncbi:MAG: hypothetical protein VB858_16040, partial [Planctomycetaceae bacterium]
MSGRTLLTLACGIFLFGFSATAIQAQDAPVSLEVFPTDVNLKTLRDRQSFVVQAAYANGLTRDVTSEAKLTLADTAPARLEGNVLYPAADGVTEMKVDFSGLSKV